MPRVHGIDRSSKNSNNGSIKPVSRTSLDSLEFSSASFSVDVVTDKPAPLTVVDTGGFGIAPALESNDVRTINPVLSWLYDRCSSAIETMSSMATPLELSSKIISAIYTHYDTVGEDDNVGALQALLFAAIKGGKRMDLNLVFEVCERREELRGSCEKRDDAEWALSSIAEGEDAAALHVETAHDETDTREHSEAVQKSFATDDNQSNAQNENHAADKSVRAALSSLNLDDTQLPSAQLRQNTGINDLGSSILHQEVTQLLHENANIDPQLRPTTKSATTTNIWKVPRSRHKRRSKDGQSNNKMTAKHDDETILNSGQSEASSNHFIGGIPFENTTEATSIKIPATTTAATACPQKDNNSISPHISNLSSSSPPNKMNGPDFPIQNDLEIKDNIQWSFQPTEQQLLEIEQKTSPEKRVTTRSMDYDLSTKNDEIAEERGTNGKRVIVADATENGNAISESEGAAKSEARRSPRKNRSNPGMELQSECSDSSANRQRGKRSDTVRVMFTGFNPTQRHKEMIHSFGAELVENIEDAANSTHIIVSDGKTKLRRTPKLMICISRVSNIVNIDWLEQSFQQQQLLDPNDFLHVHDAEAETRYNFSMHQTIQNGIIARRHRGGVLGETFIYICRGVAGNQAPTLEELQLIIESAGGTMLRSLDGTCDFNPTHTIILTSDPRTQLQMNESGVEDYVMNGAKVFTTTWLFNTIMTQNLVEIDDTETMRRFGKTSPSKNASKFSSLVRCHSQESLVSALTPSPVKRSTDQRRTSIHGNASICSGSSPGSKVSHLEYANKFSQRTRQKVDTEADEPQGSIPQSCNFISKHHFLSTFSPTAELVTKDSATIQTHTLWLNYCREFGAGSSPKTPRVGKGVRCRRGRKQSLSPLVTCTSAPDNHVSADTTSRLHDKTHHRPHNFQSGSNSLPEYHEYVSWEAYVLFSLRERAAKLDGNQTFISAKNVQAERHFPKPLSIDYSKKKLFLSIDCAASSLDSKEISEQQVFGTFQDLFDLHQKYLYDSIPESVIARLAILAVEAISAMHECGVVHNDITLDSFLIVKDEEDDSSDGKWCLRLLGFGYKSLVLNCDQQSNYQVCKGNHFDHDYKCLANVIHLLITGGMQITVTEVSGKLEFASKEFLKGNLYFRGALSWCALFDALMCVGDNFDLTPFKVQYPFDMSDTEVSEVYPKCRKYQISWACRILHEITSTNCSLSMFLKGLYHRNPRFIQPNVSYTIFSFSASSRRQSFVMCQPSVKPSTSASNLDNDDIVNIKNQLRDRERSLLYREAMIHTKISSVQEQLQENKALRASNIEVEHMIKLRETGLIQKEEEIALEIQRVQKMKEDLYARERLLELRMQQMAGENVPPSETVSFLPHSPCNSTHGRLSDCSSRENGHITSSRGKKRRKRGKERVSQLQMMQPEHETHTPQNKYRISHSPAPRSSEHLCSLQNLSRSVSLSSASKMQRQLNYSPNSILDSTKCTPKKVFIGMDVVD